MSLSNQSDSFLPIYHYLSFNSTMIIYRKSQLMFLSMGGGLIFLFASCLTKNQSSITAKNLEYLKSKYSVATINYFYETVFHEDNSVEKLSNVSKWNYCPKIAIINNHNSEERRYVQTAIKQLNALNLPIKYTLTDRKDSAAIRIFFGNLNQIRAFLNIDSTSFRDDDPSSHAGTVKVTSYDGVIDKADIGIYFTKDDSTSSSRYMVVLEEIIQSLGAGGDSYNYPGSLFFENYNSTKSLTRLDVDVLALLYEAVIPANYTRQAFEKDFSGELFAVNTNQKIKDLLEKNQRFSVGDIQKCFTKGVLIKHPKETLIYLSGDVLKEDSLTVAQAILSLNKLSPNLKIKLAETTANDPRYGIVLIFRKNDQQKVAIKRTNEVFVGKTCMYPKLIKNKVTLSIRNGKIDTELRQRSIIEALYFSLIPMPQEPSHTSQLFKIKDGSITFTPRYVNLLKALYSNEFLDGLKLSEFLNIKSSIAK